MNVILLAHTPQPEQLVACGAKLCYSSAAISNVMDGLDADKTREFLEMLAGLGHASPLEHASFTFGIEGVSRSLLAQLTRHRIASYSVKSQRYVKEGGFSYVVPPEIEKNEQAKALFLQAMEEDQARYDALVALLSAQHVGEGLSPRDARKKAQEDARFVLPNACTTNLIVSMNARALLNFFKERCCKRAQWEIRELAERMCHLVRKVAPTIFSKSGPGCAFGPCPEGAMSCGSHLEMRARYGAEGKL